MSRHTPQVARSARGGSLLSSYRGVICDLDGVVYRGGRAVEGAREALERAESDGVGVVFATNNASRPPEEVASALTRLGIHASIEAVVTSAQAGAARVLELVGAGAPVVALGGPGVVSALAEYGLVPISPDGKEPAAVLQGYGPGLTVADFSSTTGHLARGVPWVVTNADLTLPVEWGQAPGNGAYVELLRSVAGRAPDAVVGKPEPPLYDLAVERLSIPREQVLAVGDRLDTDIDGARTARVDSAWVLTGVHGPADLVAAPRPAPTYILGSLRDLLVPYAAPYRSDGGWVCGGFGCEVVTPTVGTPRLVLTHVDRPADAAVELPLGERLPIEVVRAGLAALLDARDNTRAVLADLVAAAEGLQARQGARMSRYRER